MRLDKFLAEVNIGTRSQVKAIIKKGLVTVNGAVAKQPEQKIDTQKDIITYNGQVYQYEQFVYYMLHKPAGVVTATKDNFSQTVMDLLDTEGKKNLFPVGRLDKDTEGLLLITDDGALAHDLLSPAKHVDKTYLAYLEYELTKENVEALEKGVDIGDEKPTLPAILEDVTKKYDVPAIYITIREGRFHQIKRMLEAVGNKVTYLKRLSMGNLRLDETLALGEYRRLTSEEIEQLKRS